MVVRHGSQPVTLNEVLRVRSRGSKTPAELLTGVVSAIAVARLTRLGVQADALKSDTVLEEVLGTTGSSRRDPHHLDLALVKGS